MKASKQFATSHGQSHLPSNMIHIDAETINVTTPEGTPIVILELRRPREDKPTYLRIRMNVDEARRLSEQILLAVTKAQCGHSY